MVRSTIQGYYKNLLAEQLVTFMTQRPVLVSELSKDKKMSMELVR